jgi:hypothetical protein
MPFVRRHARVISGALPETHRSGRSQTSGRSANGTGKGLTEAKKAEITAAFLAKWEKKGVGSRRKRPEPKRGGSKGTRRSANRAPPVAEPRAVVARTFKPAGKLQLHRLSERARFYCVHCRQDTAASLVATMNGDWAQTLCNSCYASLVHAERAKAKKSANAERRRQQERRPQPRKVTLTEKVGGPPRPITEQERLQLEQRLPGVNRMLTFFIAAGVQVEVVRNGSLRLNGNRTPPLAKMRRSSGMRNWDDVIDDMALTYVGDTFIKAVEDNARFGEGLRAFLLPRKKCFAVKRGDVPLAMIHATRAYIPDRDVIHGNFLQPGTHWQQIASILYGAEAELIAAWKQKQEAKAAEEAVTAASEAERRQAAGRRRMDLLPNDLALKLIDACLDASRRIRLERQVAYERPVVLECELGELTLLPIAGSETHLLVPFRLMTGAQTLNGELVIGDCDPLPLLIGQGVAEQDAITAWTCALLGFADVTCIEMEPVNSTRTREQARSRWRPPSSVEPQQKSVHPQQKRAPPPRRKRPWPAHLEPVGQWIPYSGSFVAGHRRRLSRDQTGSDEARQRARRVGIILKTHETWVRPHARGVPHGIEMRFLWHAPTELKLSTRNP